MILTFLQKAIRKDSKGQERFEDYFSDSEEEQASKNSQSVDAAPADKTTEKPTEDDSMEVDEGAKPADEAKEPEKEKEKEKEDESKKAPEKEYEEWKKKSLKKGEKAKEAEKTKEKEDSNSASKEKEQPKIITAKKSTAAVTVTMAATEEDEGETMEDIENFISKDATADAEESESAANKVMYGQVSS